MQISLQQTVSGPRLVSDRAYARPELNSRMKMRADTAHMYIYDEIGPWWAGMYGAETFIEDLAAAGDRPVRLHFNSPGGDVFEGMAIFSLIRSDDPSRFSAQIDGLAASMASLIPLATSHVEISRAGRMMIHSPWSLAVGNAEELRAQAAILDEVAAQAAGLYASRTGNAIDLIQSWMAADTYMGPDDAIERGFAHSLLVEGSDLPAPDPALSVRESRVRAQRAKLRVADMSRP